MHDTCVCETCAQERQRELFRICAETSVSTSLSSTPLEKPSAAPTMPASFVDARIHDLARRTTDLEKGLDKRRDEGGNLDRRITKLAERVTAQGALVTEQGKQLEALHARITRHAEHLRADKARLETLEERTTRHGEQLREIVEATPNDGATIKASER